MECEIIQITDLNLDSLHPLAIEAQSEGYNFIVRTIYDWNSKVNDFSKKGERLFGILISDNLIGIGGLNVDPFVNNPKIGRIRHIYISQKFRRKGYASLLMRKLIKIARKYFELLRLYTDNPIASSFYKSLGFVESNSFKVTHILNLDIK